MDYFGEMPMDEDIPAFERLDCSNCHTEFNYSRDNVYVCGGSHPLCSVCCTRNDQVVHDLREKLHHDPLLGKPGIVLEGGARLSPTCVAEPADRVAYHANEDPDEDGSEVLKPCKYLNHGCTFWDADEAVLAEHQGECPQRPVGCIFECEAVEVMKAEVKAKDYVRHLKEVHGLAMDGSWTLWNDRSALRLWAQDGIHFLAVLTGNDRNCWQVWVETVAAAPRLAKKYRSSMRLSSEAGGSNGTFEGPVWSMETFSYWDININNINKTDILFISSSEFECHNGGMERLGEHNRTEDGSLELPISIKVERVDPLEEGEVED